MSDMPGAVGDHFLIGLRPSPTLHPLDRALLADLRPAGIVLFKSNFRHDLDYAGWIESHAALVDDVRGTIGRERLLVAIDHEGGRVTRTPPPITRFSYPSRWAADAAAVGAAMGRELASLGVNLNFAPLLDIHSNPANPVIHERAFGTTPEEVARSGTDFVAAMEKQGVLACGKHFPGHGDTSVDSHHALPTLSLDLAELRGRELAPFSRAIEAGLCVIMTSHILFPKIDPDWPATLSSRLVKVLLREEMGFNGVVVSDDIGMHAMDAFFDRPDSAVRFLQAGNDLLMLCAHWTDTGRARDFAAAIADATASGELTDDVLEDSRRRIARLLDQACNRPISMLSPAQLAEDRRAGALFDAATVEVI
jgi:beta-N-acetylhexosaminidase